MSKTGFKCPKCGNDERFEASMVIAVFHGCTITPDGWDYMDSWGEVDLADEATLSCEECGYEGYFGEFEEV